MVDGNSKLTKVISLSSLWSGPSPHPFFMVDFLPPSDLLLCSMPTDDLRRTRKEKKGEEDERLSFPESSPQRHFAITQIFLFPSLVISYLLVLIFFLATENFQSLLFCLAVWNLLMLSHVKKKVLYSDKHLGFKRFTEWKDKDIKQENRSII